MRPNFGPGEIYPITPNVYVLYYTFLLVLCKMNFSYPIVLIFSYISIVSKSQEKIELQIVLVNKIYRISV